MKMHTAVRNFSFVLSGSSLALAYLLGGYPLALIAIAGAALLRVMLNKWSTFWVDSSLLALYMLAAVMGIVLNAPLLLLVIGGVLALVSWDLSDFGRSLVAEVPAEARAALQEGRLRSLALTSGISLALTAAASLLRLQLPFAAVALLALLTTGGVLYSVQRLRSVSSNPEKHS